MDFSLTPEQVKRKNEVADFVRENIADGFETESFPYEAWRKCAEFGIQSMASVAPYGGKADSIDFLTSVIAMESFGYACPDNGLAFALNAQMWTIQLPIVQFGTDLQKEKYLPAFAKGEIIGSHALTESNTGSDVFAMEMKAEKVDGGYILNGTKRMISLAPVADVVFVFANSDPDKGKWGISAFLVETETSGVSVEGPLNKMGLKTVPMGNIEFKDCFVTDDCLIGKEGAGFSLSNHSLEYERCSILASQLGAMERQLEQVIKYAKTRKQFGKSIGSFQSVSNRIADMRLRLETSRLLLYKTSWLKQQGKNALLESSLLKLHLSECFLESSLDAVRTFGGYGYLHETGVEHDLRDSVGGLLYAGTSDIQRNIVSRLLGL